MGVSVVGCIREQIWVSREGLGLNVLVVLQIVQQPKKAEYPEADLRYAILHQLAQLSYRAVFDRPRFRLD